MGVSMDDNIFCAIVIICLLGWIPVMAICCGVEKVILAFKDNICDMCECNKCEGEKEEDESNS